MFKNCISLFDLNIPNISYIIDKIDINDIFDGCLDKLIMNIRAQFINYSEDLEVESIPFYDF